ncbi:retinol-binding protein pinta-like [Nylanderia fulva]|uniref:retinol-binding protein pinta-like n=1 Tax=Nylanderia fulva TaxID=613905 RepID=UPI0010FAF70D|nr:retinol-binding protein pinta-like [Nylanderia fulva]
MAEPPNCSDNSPLKLTSEQKEYAAKVLNESDEDRENAISEIKRWIQESDLRARTDDFTILRFLRVCKFNIEKTKTKMQNYQMQRAKLPEWYANRDPLQPKLQELLDLGICLPLRKLDDQGRLVIIVRLVHDPHIITVAEAVKVSSVVVDLVLRDSIEASLYGFVVIIDLGDATLRHVAQLTPSVVMNVIHAWQGCYPVRIQLLNYINVPGYAKLFLELTKYFLNKKLRERFHFYSRQTAHECFKDMPVNILPVEYGGTDGTIQDLIEYWKKVIEENREWVIDDEKYKPILK